MEGRNIVYWENRKATVASLQGRKRKLKEGETKKMIGETSRKALFVLLRILIFVQGAREQKGKQTRALEGCNIHGLFIEEQINVNVLHYPQNFSGLPEHLFFTCVCSSFAPSFRLEAWSLSEFLIRDSVSTWACISYKMRWRIKCGEDKNSISQAKPGKQF